MKTLSKRITIILIMLSVLTFVVVGNVKGEGYNYHDHMNILQQQEENQAAQQELNEMRRQTEIMEENQREQKRRNYDWQNPFGN